MKISPSKRYVGIVDTHRSEGVTSIHVHGLRHGPVEWLVSTARIPPTLRALGSRVLLTSPSIEVEDDDSAEAIRAALDEEYIDALPEPVSLDDARSGRQNIVEAAAAALRAADAAKDDD